MATEVGNLNTEKKQKNDEVDSSLLETQTHSTPDDKTDLTENSDGEITGGTREQKASQNFVNQAKENYQQDKMTSSYEELRELTGVGGRDLGRPPHHARESSFTAVGSGRQALQMRSSLKTTAVSLPGSRGHTPNPDTLLSTGRRSTTGTEMKCYIVDKEVLESQLRKLKTENSSLVSENKLLKEKHNRAQARIQNLETQLLSAQTVEVDSIQLQKSNEFIGCDQQLLEQKIEKLSRDVQKLKTENETLEKQIATGQLTSNLDELSGDRSLIIASFKTELTAVRGEMSKVKLLLEQAERDCHDEAERRQEAFLKMTKLTEMTALLQQKMDGAGGGVAEKQVKSLEKRLKVTEDRLHQERADRAGKLSQVEEKLVQENAQLQVSEKDLQRQLQREQDKNINLDVKYKDCREENDRFRTIVSNNMPDETTWSLLRDSMQAGQTVRGELESCSERATSYMNLYEDSKQEKQTIQDTLRGRMQELVKDKHAAQANIFSLEDKVAAVSAERDSLQCSQTLSARNSLPKQDSIRTFEGELQTLKNELHTVRAELQKQLRHNKLIDAESESMRVQLKAKEDALNEALGEIARGLIKSDVSGHHLADISTTQKLALQTQLNEREQEILRLTADYNEKENALLRNQQVLAGEQQVVERHIAEMERVQLELRQKSRLITELCEAKANDKVEVTSLRQTLQECNEQLGEYEHELKTVTVNMNRTQALVDSLEKELKEKNTELNPELMKKLEEDPPVDCSSEVLTHAESKATFLQFEINRLRKQVQNANEAVEEVINENTKLLSHLRQTHQNLVMERAQLCHVTCQKVELDQRWHISDEENAKLTKDRARLEDALSKQEQEIVRLIGELDRDSGGSKLDLYKTYDNGDGKAKEAVAQLITCKALLEAREKESQFMKETIERQKQEISSLNYQVAVLKEESVNNQKEFDRLANHWTTQLKETASDGTGHALATERTKLQLEKLQGERESHKELQQMQSKVYEVNDLHKQLEHADDSHKQTEKHLHQQEIQLVSLETELRHQDQTVQNLEKDRTELKAELFRSQQELHNIKDLNNTLEQRLSVEKNVFVRKESDRSHLNEELGQTSRHLGSLKMEYDLVVSQLDKQKQCLYTLKDKCQNEEKEVLRLQRENRSAQAEVDTLRQELDRSHAQGGKHLKDNEALYKEVEDLSRLIEQKDKVLSKLQLANEECIDSARQVYNMEKAVLLEQQDRVQAECEMHKDRTHELKEQLRQKERELDGYMKVNIRLEGDAKMKYDLENEVSKLEVGLSDSRRSILRVETENSRLSEQHRHIQDNYESQKNHTAMLEKELTDVRIESTKENAKMLQHIQKERRTFELEKNDLQDKLTKTSADLRAAESSLAAVQEQKDSLAASYQSAERSINTLKSQVHDQITGRKLSEQRTESLLVRLDDSKLDKTGLDERSMELTTRLASLENEYIMEKDKTMQVKHDLQLAELTIAQLQAQSQNIMLHFEEAKAENSCLKGQFESLKQDLIGKNKRLALELRQNSDNYDNDRRKLVAQAEQFSTDLDVSREHVGSKNRENLQLQEKILALEGHLRETTTDVKQLKDSLSVEEQTRDRLDKRNMELELLLAKVRAKDTDNIGYEANKDEVQKMIKGLGKKMQDQLDNQKGYDSELLAKERKRAEELKKKLSGLESQFSQEQAMHIVSKTQLQSADDENQRLRTQIASLRKRLSHTTQNEPDRSKSRIEEINEIIAKSQNRARQMLAVGNFNPSDPLKLNTSFNPQQFDLSTQSNLPNSQYWRMTSSPRAHNDVDTALSLGGDEFNY